MSVIDKMVMLGTFKTGSLENYFVSGFVKQGIKVQTFNVEREYQDLISKVVNRLSPRLLLREMNSAAQKFCKEQNADVIFVCKGMALFPETIAEIKKYARLIVNYNPDHPYKFFSRGSGNSNISESLVHYDIFFSYSRKIAEDVQTKYNIESHCIPFGYDADTAKKYAAEYIDVTNDSFLFFGAWDDERSSFLNCIERRDLQIFGDPEWKTKTGRQKYIQQNFQNKKLYGKDLYQKIRSDLGVINLLRTQNMVEGSHNMRTFEVPGYGGLLLSQFTEEQASFFTPGKEAMYFNSVEELKDKMEYLKRNLNVVNSIKANAVNRCIGSGYSYDNRCRDMISIINEFN